jgi:hypothetical protein
MMRRREMPEDRVEKAVERLEEFQSALRNMNHV